MNAVVVLITDPRVPLARTIEVAREAAIALGPRLCVQLRDKREDVDRVEAARALRRVTREAGASFVVNAGAAEASIAIAREIGADGVHVPGEAREDETARLAPGAIRRALGEAGALRARAAGAIRRALGEAIVTVAAHDDDDVRRAIDAGADAVLVSPIFATPGKGAPRGLDAIARARAIASARDARLRVFALGGVDDGRAASCAEAGADGVAVIRALLDASHPAAIAARLGAPFASGAR